MAAELAQLCSDAAGLQAWLSQAMSLQVSNTSPVCINFRLLAWLFDLDSCPPALSGPRGQVSRMCTHQQLLHDDVASSVHKPAIAMLQAGTLSKAAAACSAGTATPATTPVGSLTWRRAAQPGQHRFAAAPLHHNANWSKRMVCLQAAAAPAGFASAPPYPQQVPVL